MLVDARCVPTPSCATNPHEVTVRGYLLLSGRGLQAGLVVAFPRSRNATIASNSPLTRICAVARRAGGAPCREGAHCGRIQVLHRRRAAQQLLRPITVVPYALHPPKPKAPRPPPADAAGDAGAFEGQGMWIWYLSKSSGGSLPAIVAQAHAAGVSTVFVKSSRRQQQLLEPVLAANSSQRCTPTG